MSNNTDKAASAIQASGNPENPSDSVNPEAGMKKPQVMPKGKKKKKITVKDMHEETTMQGMISEGDFVMGMTSEGLVHGMVEHIMIEGGVYGVPGTEYAIQSMPPENPAMAVRVYKEEDGTWEPTAYSIGMMYKDAEIIDMEDHTMEEEGSSMDSYDNSIGKAEDMLNEELSKSYHSDDEDMDKWDNITKACWVGYEQRGMKDKDGRMVPNCVPVGKADDVLEDDMEKAKKPNYSEIIEPRRGGSNPANPKLYARVVQAAKDKFDVYPSAVANSWVVQEYKRRGGTYKSDDAPATKSLWSGAFDPKGFIK